PGVVASIVDRQRTLRTSADPNPRLFFVFGRDLLARPDVAVAVVVDGEDLGGQRPAASVSAAQIVVDADLHAVTRRVRGSRPSAVPVSSAARCPASARTRGSGCATRARRLVALGARDAIRD